MRGILGPVDVRRDDTSDVTEADLQGNCDGSLVFTGDISTQPCDGTGGGRMCPRDTQECTKVLYPIGGVRNVNGETDRRNEKPSENKRPTYPEAIRKNTQKSTEEWMRQQMAEQ